MFYNKVGVSLVLVVAVSACGGGSGKSNTGGGTGPVVVVPPPPPPRGTLVGGPLQVPIPLGGTAGSVTTLAPQQFRQLLESEQSGMSGVTSTPVCAVSSYTVRYNTIGATGEATERRVITIDEDTIDFVSAVWVYFPSASITTALL